VTTGAGSGVTTGAGTTGVTSAPAPGVTVASGVLVVLGVLGVLGGAAVVVALVAGATVGGSVETSGAAASTAHKKVACITWDPPRGCGPARASCQTRKTGRTCCAAPSTLFKRRC
jgi:hypothetical protein